MKNCSVALAVLLMVFGLSLSPASAEMYASGNVGAVIVEDADIDDGVDAGEISFDTGFGVTAALGHAYGNGLRSEVEIGYRMNDLDEVEALGLSVGVDGDISTFSGMINGYYDIIPNAAFTPFIGGGIGFAHIEVDFDDFGSEDDTVFAYQLAAGGSFATSENINLDLQYRYFATSDPEFDGAESEYKTHNVMLGLRYSF